MAISSLVDFSGLTYCGEEARNIFAKDIYDIDLRQYGITFMDGLMENVRFILAKLVMLGKPMRAISVLPVVLH